MTIIFELCQVCIEQLKQTNAKQTIAKEISKVSNAK